VIVEAKIKVPDWKKIKEEVRNKAGLVTAATMQTQRGLIFANSGVYNGRSAWAPLKLRSGQPLKDRGTLSKSIGPATDGEKPKRNNGTIVEISQETITIGTNLYYAALMNFGTEKMPGGVMRAKNGKVLAFPGRSGKRSKRGKKSKMIFAKYVRIPARRFDEITQEDKQEIVETLQSFVSRELNR
jgi:phage gpG-like protein